MHCVGEASNWVVPVAPGICGYCNRRRNHSAKRQPIHEVASRIGAHGENRGDNDEMCVSDVRKPEAFATAAQKKPVVELRR